MSSPGPRSGLTLALSWLTVLPVRGPEPIDRALGRRAIAWAPATGALLGALAAGALWLAQTAGAAPLLAGLIAVAGLVLCTRGMHVDGLADTADGLGCYGPPERAQQVMRSGGAGPFGVAALIICLVTQAVCLGTLAADGRWLAVVLAVIAGRVSVVIACRRGIDAARESGFGALVAGTQPRWLGAVWAAAALAVSTAAVTEAWWQGPLTIAVALGGAALLAHHAVTRFAGLSGDVLGAAIEVTVTIAAVGLSL